ncbi:Rieske 2Fe-2S domain-containing protein [Streptomyces sp. NPDC005373]|uniref:Rieske 2Fe-2S domain-containing protein n=1 Tax=Streptomyces sp. NPDC005373 TaxID=3156879 RepID=UPI0033AC0BC5
MGSMALSMKPTGWFQVAWSAEIEPGAVRRMRYFGQELIAYRGAGGKLTVMDAYCEHLGAHLGHGGTVNGDNIVCPFHGWEWNCQGRNVHIPYQERANKVRRIRVWPVVERNEGVFVWHDLEGRDPLYEVPDIFALFDDEAKAEDYYRAYPECVLSREALPIHPQYVIENGVDFAHFKFVHRTDEVPTFTRQDFDEWCFYADFDMKWRPSKTSSATGEAQVVHGGTQAFNAGISLGFSRSWGTANSRSLITVTPVDDETSDIRSTSWLEKLPGDDGPARPEKLERRVRVANNQFLADVNIWEHQRYTEPPGLATAEARGFRMVRRWARRFYPEGERGSGAAEQDAGVEAGLAAGSRED